MKDTPLGNAWVRSVVALAVSSLTVSIMELIVYLEFLQREAQRATGPTHTSMGQNAFHRAFSVEEWRPMKGRPHICIFLTAVGGSGGAAGTTELPFHRQHRRRNIRYVVSTTATLQPSAERNAPCGATFHGASPARSSSSFAFRLRPMLV